MSFSVGIVRVPVVTKVCLTLSHPSLLNSGFCFFCTNSPQSLPATSMSINKSTNIDGNTNNIYNIISISMSEFQWISLACFASHFQYATITYTYLRRPNHYPTTQMKSFLFHYQKLYWWGIQITKNPAIMQDNRRNNENINEDFGCQFDRIMVNNKLSPSTPVISWSLIKRNIVWDSYFNLWLYGKSDRNHHQVFITTNQI